MYPRMTEQLWAHWKAEIKAKEEANSIRVAAYFDDGIKYLCKHHSEWQTQPCKKCEIEDRQMNKEMQEKIANWKAANSIDGFCSILGLSLEEMVEAAEMWRERKALLATETHWPDKGLVVWEERNGISDINRFRFDTVKQWFEWLKGYRSLMVSGRLTVGDFKVIEKCNCKKEGYFCRNSNDPTCQADKLWPKQNANEKFAYKVGDQLKIKMPQDWDIVKDDKLLTRQEAINKLMAAENTFDPGYASRQIDVFINLGMLKLKEEKVTAEFKNEKLFTNKLDDDIIKEAENLTANGSIVGVSFDNIRNLVDLIGKLLNIIKRGKP